MKHTAHSPSPTTPPLTRRALVKTAAAGAATAALGPAAAGVAAQSLSAALPQGAQSLSQPLGSSVCSLFLPQGAYAAEGVSRALTTIERYLGATRTALEELLAHEHDSYYLGTSYGNTGPDGQGGSIDSWDCWYPNGNPKSNGQSYMNCAGFIVAVLEACGANCDYIGSYVASTGYDRGNKSNLSRWKNFLVDNAQFCTRFDSKEALLASGLLRKGDIIIAEPNDWSAAGADNHIMFFWGNASDEDLAWHSASHGDGIIAGTAPGNMISRITAKHADCYWLFVPLENFIEVLLQKRSANVALSGEHGANPAYSLEGASFSIFESYENGELSGLLASCTTDADGCASVQLRPNATVWIREDSAPRGFALWNEPVQATVENGQPLPLFDSPCAISLSVVKVDAETGACAQGWATLEGAVYELTDANGSTHTALTQWDESRSAWVACFDALPRGIARLREAVPPVGYAATPLPHAAEDGWLDLELSPDSHEALSCMTYDAHAEHVMRGDIVGAKFAESTDGASEKQGLAGCRFAIWLEDDGSLAARGYDVGIIVDGNGTPLVDSSGAARRGSKVGEVTSHEDGRFTSRDLLDEWDPSQHNGAPSPACALPYGTYTLVETLCPKPELRLAEPISGIEVRANGQEIFIILEDRLITSPVRVRKVDATTKEPLLKAGTEIELLRKTDSGSFEVVELPERYPFDGRVSTFVVSENGTVQFPEALAWGAYAIREVKALAPYTLNEQPVEFFVEEHRDWASEQPLEITLENTAATGRIEGRKVDAESGEGVAGAVYELRAESDIILPDGMARLHAGDLVGTCETDENGAWSFEELPLGESTTTYLLSEICSPDGYVLDERTHRVTLSYQDQRTPVVCEQVSIEEQPTRVRIRKVDIESGEPIEGVEFAVSIIEKQADAAQEALEAPSAETPYATAVTDASGEATLLRLPCDETYLFEETSTRVDLGYVNTRERAQRYLSPEGWWFESKESYEASVNASEACPHESEAIIAFENDFTKLLVYKVDQDVWRTLAEAHDSIEEADVLKLGSEAFLSGGLFQLTDATGALFSPQRGEAIAEVWHAQGQSPFMVTHIPPGSYAVHESQAPEGYERCSEKMGFTIEERTEPHVLVIENRKDEGMPQTGDILFGGLPLAAAAAAAAGGAFAAYSARRSLLERTGEQ